MEDKADNNASEHVRRRDGLGPQRDIWGQSKDETVIFALPQQQARVW